MTRRSRKVGEKFHGIYNRYTYIPMNVMVDFGKENGVNFKTKIVADYPVPARLADVEKAIKDYVIAGSSSRNDWMHTYGTQAVEPWKSLRMYDLHFSAMYAKIGLAPQFVEKEGSDKKSNSVDGRRGRIIQDG